MLDDAIAEGVTRDEGPGADGGSNLRALVRDDTLERQPDCPEHQADGRSRHRHDQPLSIRQRRGGLLIVRDGEAAEPPELDRRFEPVASERQRVAQLMNDQRHDKGENEYPDLEYVAWRDQKCQNEEWQSAESEHWNNAEDNGRRALGTRTA